MPIVRAAFCIHFPALAHYQHLLLASQQVPAAAERPDPMARSLVCPLPFLERLPPERDPFAKGISPGARALFVQNGARAALLAGAKTVVEVARKEDGEGEQLMVRSAVLRRLYVQLFSKDRHTVSLTDMEAAQQQVVEAVYRLVQTLGAKLGNR